MAFKRTPQVFSSAVNEVTFGKGDRAVTIGGANVLPLYSFDAALKHRAAVGAEIYDTGIDSALEGMAEFYAGCITVADYAKRASEAEGADFVALTFAGADPAGLNRSVDECCEIAKEVVAAIDCPLAILGCKNIEKDTALFEKLAEVLQGENVLFVSCREENYKVLSAAVGIAYGQKLSAESAVDINLAKQLNVLMSQIGMKTENHVMNVGSAAAGYGFEYVASTMDRVRSAALAQDDKALQMPIITPVGDEAWSVKEAVVSEEDIPEWGDREKRGISMEVSSAAAVLASGSDAVILRHPESIRTISRLVAELM